MAQFAAPPSYAASTQQEFAYPTKSSSPAKHAAPMPVYSPVSPVQMGGYYTGGGYSPTVVSTPTHSRMNSMPPPMQYAPTMVMGSPSYGGMAPFSPIKSLPPVSRSPHHSLVQNTATGQVTNVIGGMSDNDMDNTINGLWTTMRKLRQQVDYMIRLSSSSIRTLFRQNKLKWTFARNSCLSAGELDPDTSLCEKYTRDQLIHWNISMDAMLHQLNFEANSLLDNEKFSSDFNKLAELMKKVVEKLRAYRPGHGILGCCIPREPFNGCKKMAAAATELLETLTGIGNINRVVNMRQDGNINVQRNINSRAQSNTNRVTHSGENGTQRIIQQDGQTVGVVRNDMYGQAQLSEVLPSIQETPIVVVAAQPVMVTQDMTPGPDITTQRVIVDNVEVELTTYQP